MYTVLMVLLFLTALLLWTPVIAVSLLVGLKVKSTHRGLLPLLAFSVLFIGCGVALSLSGRTTDGPDAQTSLDLVQGSLILVGVSFGVISGISWTVGRLMRTHRRPSADSKPPNSMETRPYSPVAHERALLRSWPGERRNMG